jgi:hypothetical protein
MVGQRVRRRRKPATRLSDLRMSDLRTVKRTVYLQVARFWIT